MTRFPRYASRLGSVVRYHALVGASALASHIRALDPFQSHACLHIDETGPMVAFLVACDASAIRIARGFGSPTTRPVLTWSERWS